MKSKEYYIRLGEAVQKLEEKNCPTDPSKWSYYKSQAKEKFDVYPSAYANGWASKQYGDAGGGWKKCENEATDSQEKEFHTQLDKLVHKTFGKSPEEEKMDEKFDRTHLGILKYAYKDIDKINPSDPMYVRVAQMLDKLSKQELQQLIDADIKFISLLAKNRLSKKESVNEEKVDMEELEMMLKKLKKENPGKKVTYSFIKGKQYPKGYVIKINGKILEGESVNESHFQVGDNVTCLKSGMTGQVVGMDKPHGADDEEYYTVKRQDGEVMKYSPNELRLTENTLKEGLFQDIMRAVKKGDGPFTLVVIKNNKVIKQVEVKTPQAIPANYSSLLKDFPNTRIRIEDATGKIVMGESVNEAKAIGKKIFSDAKGKLFFGYQNDDDTVQLVDYKTWKKLPMTDLSNEFMANRIINSIVRNERQFNKKVEYNMWSKKTNPSFEERMDYFIKNNWISNITKTGIKESVNESSMSNIDIIAQEAKDFKDFVKEFYNEYKDFPKDRDTIKWLKGVYDNRSTNESVESLDEKLPNEFATIPNDSRVDGMMKHLQHHLGVISKNVKTGKGVYKKDLMKMANIIKALQMYESKSVNESSVEIGDIVLFPPANSAATVVDRFGRSVTLKLANGKKVKTVVDKVKLLAQDNVNEGNAFTGALFKARKEGLTEFEFNGKKYPVHKLEEEKEETLAESKLTKDSLKQIIKEEYHNVKTFMEEKYGFTPELGKVYSNLAAKPFLKEEEEEVVDEYDVENYQDLKEFVQFMAEYKSDINEAEYQGRKVKLGKIMQGDVKKFKVYVKNDKGNVVKVNFGQGGDAKGGTMRIRKDNPKARASFRARHNCDNPGPRWKARYWSCRKW
jgi:hypothetical protein